MSKDLYKSANGKMVDMGALRHIVASRGQQSNNQYNKQVQNPRGPK